MATTLKDTLKELQILLGKPQKKIAGTLKYYLDFFSTTKAPEEPTKEQKKDKIRIIRHKKITWMDIKDPARREISRLAEIYPFHPLHLEDCISKWQFPKIEQNTDDKYLFLLLRFPTISRIDEKIVTNQVCFFLGRDYLVTTHENASGVISDVFHACKVSPKQREAFMDNSASHLLYVLMDHLTADFAPLMQTILQEVDETEDIVFDDKVSAAHKLGQLRQKITSLRRTLVPLRALIGDLVKRVNKFTASNLSVYFENITHRVDKAWETLEEARETVEIYKDADFIISTEKTNRTLAVLTIIFTLSIPATVLGSLYGMNILLPGGIETGTWMFWGKYTTLIIILILAALPAVFMAWFFKKKNWF